MTARHGFKILGWMLIGSLSLLLFWNSRFYLTDPMRVPFYQERIHEASTGWGPILQVHVLGGLICLLTGPFLFLSPRLQWVRHQSWGILYLIACVLMLPTGLVLSFTAHGGFIGQLGFFLTGLWMCFCVIRGMQCLPRHDYQTHAAWMMRSYAIACSALTFRLIYLAGFFAHLPYNLNYPLSTWLSSILNVLICEGLLRFSQQPSIPQPGQPHETTTPHPLPFRIRLLVRQ